MPKNYNSTNNLPSTRVIGVTMDYPTQGNSTVTYATSEALTDAVGNIHVLEGRNQQTTMNIDPTDTTPLQVYNPWTGEAIPGQFTNVETIVLGLYAAIHANQLALDAASELP